MSVGEICNREVVVADKEEDAREAARLMRQYHVGDLVVVERRGEESIPLGVVTDRDLVIEVLANAKNRSVGASLNSPEDDRTPTVADPLCSTPFR